MGTLAEQFDKFLFDLDGVVYVGDQPLPGSVEALGRLRAMGKAVRFLTNDSRFARVELARRLNPMGIEATPEEVVSCGWATAADSFPTSDRPAPGTGAIVRAVEAVTGRRAQIVGKPYPWAVTLPIRNMTTDGFACPETASR